MRRGGAPKEASHERDHHEGRRAHLLRGLEQRTARRVQPRLAPQRGRLGCSVDVLLQGAAARDGHDAPRRDQLGSPGVLQLLGLETTMASKTRARQHRSTTGSARLPAGYTEKKAKVEGVTIS